MEAQRITEHQPFSDSQVMFQDLLAQLGSAECMAMPHQELEAWINQKGREVLRQTMQDQLTLRGLAEVPGGVVEGADGVVRTRRRRQKRRLMTVLGPVEIERIGYRAKGMHALTPVDVELNLPQRVYSYGVRRRVADFASRTSFDQTAQMLASNTGATVPKRQVEQLVREAAEGFDEYYAARAVEPVTEDANILVLTFDGTGVHMRVEALREQTRKQREASEGEASRWPTPAKTKAAVARNGTRMAAVSAVYQVAPHPRQAFDILRELQPVAATESQRPPRPRPQAKLVRASVEQPMATVVQQAFDEAQRRDPDHRMRWVVLVDGNEHQLDLVSRHARRLGVEVEIVLDLIHVADYVWGAAKALHPNDSKVRRQWVWEKLTTILWGDPSHAAAGMRRSATIRGLGPRTRKPVDVCADYLLKYADFMRYDVALADGLPISTGVIEGACRHLVKDRMAITGARWGLEGSEAVLRLRALRINGDFDDYMTWKEAREHKELHLSRYANGKAPVLAGPGRAKPRLRLVK